MNKNLIYTYLSGQASPEETEQLFDWINQNEENEKFFITQMNLWIRQQIPTQRTSPANYVAFRELLQKKNCSVRKQGKSPRILFLIRSAAAILLALLALNLTLLYYNHRIQLPVQTADRGISVPRTEVLKEFFTNNGVKAKIRLPDSSTVWLNSGSRLSYPETFGQESRNITFSGEAYFDVIPDSTRPMVIQNQGFAVKVLGTQFNLKNYKGDPSAQITLYCGKVEVHRCSRSGKEEITTLLPNETVILSPDKKVQKDHLTDAPVLSEWKEGKLTFRETPLPEVIKTLERWHGVTFTVQDPQVLKYKFTASFHSESIVQILEFLKMTTFTNYTVSGNNIILTKR